MNAIRNWLANLNATQRRQLMIGSAVFDLVLIATILVLVLK